MPELVWEGTMFRLVHSICDLAAAVLCAASRFAQRSGYNATTWNVPDFY